MHVRARRGQRERRRRLRLVVRRRLVRALQRIPRFLAHAEAIQHLRQGALHAGAHARVALGAGRGEQVERGGERRLRPVLVVHLLGDLAGGEEQLRPQHDVAGGLGEGERLLQMRGRLLVLAVVLLDAREVEQRARAGVRRDGRGEQAARGVQPALAELDLAHVRLHHGGAGLEAGDLGVRGDVQDGRGGAEDAARGVRPAVLRGLVHALHGDAQSEAERLLVRVRAAGVLEHRGAHLRHAEGAERLRDGGRRLQARRVESVGLARGGEGRGAEQIAVEHRIVLLAALVRLGGEEGVQHLHPAIGGGLVTHVAHRVVEVLRHQRRQELHARQRLHRALGVALAQVQADDGGARRLQRADGLGALVLREAPARARRDALARAVQPVDRRLHRVVEGGLARLEQGALDRLVLHVRGAADGRVAPGGVVRPLGEGLEVKAGVGLLGGRADAREDLEDGAAAALFTARGQRLAGRGDGGGAVRAERLRLEIAGAQQEQTAGDRGDATAGGAPVEEGLRAAHLPAQNALQAGGPLRRPRLAHEEVAHRGREVVVGHCGG